MTYLQTALPTIRSIVLLGLVAFMMAATFISTMRMLETRNARLIFIALLGTGCALGAWYILIHRPI